MENRNTFSSFNFQDNHTWNTNEEIMFKSEKPYHHRTSISPSRLPSHELEKSQSSNSQNLQRNSSRLSRRISVAIKNRPSNNKSRRRSDLTDLLCEAAAAGNAQLIGRILGAGGDYAKKNSEGLSPLHIAVMAGQGDAVRCLVRMGAEIESKDSQGYTPLHRAVMSNRVSLIPHLANLGADLNAVDAKGSTSLHIAASECQIIASTVPPSSRPTSNNSALRFSFVFDSNNNNRRCSNASARSIYDECSVIEALVRAGANIEARNQQGESALHVAVKANNLENARLLLDQGGQINIQDSDGMTPLGVLAAMESCNDALSSLLLTRGAQVTSIQPKTKKRSWFSRAVL